MEIKDKNIDVEENGNTPKENSIIKAYYISTDFALNQ